MAYAEKLKDPRWQKKRLQILNRDEFTCRKCLSKTDTLHVHHLRYERGLNPWEYEEWDLVTMCESCHELEHALFERDQRLEENIVKLFGPEMNFKCAACGHKIIWVFDFKIMCKVCGWLDEEHTEKAFIKFDTIGSFPVLPPAQVSEG